MKNKSFAILISIFLILFLLSFLIYKNYQKNELIKKNEITKLITKYYNQKQYKTARKFTEELLIKYYDDKELLEILDKINNAEKYDFHQPIVISQKVDLSDIKKMLDILKSRIDRLSERPAETTPKIIERERTIIEKNGNQRIYDEYELAKLINEGKRYYNDRLFAEASGLFKEALKLDENSIDANAYLAASFFELNPENDKTLEESSKHCKKALEFDKSNELAHFTLARIYENKKMEKEAVAELEETLKINPNNFSADYNLGRIYYNQKAFADAEKHFSNLLEIKKDFAEGYYFLSLVKIELNKTAEAKECLYKCIAGDEKFYKAYIKLAEINISENNYKDAVSNYEKAIVIDKNYQYYYALAGCYEEIGDSGKAIASYLHSINNNSLKTDKEKIMAIDCYDKIIFLEDGRGNTAQAILYAQKGIDALKERASGFYIISADLKVKTKKYNEGITDYLKAVELKIECPENIYCSIGTAYELLKDDKKALASYKKALELNKDYPDAYYRLGKIYFAQRNFKDAKASFLKVFEKKPDFVKKEEIDGFLQEIKNQGI